MKQKKVVPLTDVQIEIGQRLSSLTENAKNDTLAAFASFRLVEKCYVESLREVYDLGPKYHILDWTKGFEYVEADGAVTNVKDN